MSKAEKREFVKEKNDQQKWFYNHYLIPLQSSFNAWRILTAISKKRFWSFSILARKYYKTTVTWVQLLTLGDVIMLAKKHHKLFIFKSFILFIVSNLLPIEWQYKINMRNVANPSSNVILSRCQQRNQCFTGFGSLLLLSLGISCFIICSQSEHRFSSLFCTTNQRPGPSRTTNQKSHEILLIASAISTTDRNPHFQSNSSGNVKNQIKYFNGISTFQVIFGHQVKYLYSIKSVKGKNFNVKKRVN